MSVSTTNPATAARVDRWAHQRPELRGQRDATLASGAITEFANVQLVRASAITEELS